MLDREALAIGDLILAEVLRGFHAEREFEQTRRELTSLDIVELGDREIALKAAENFRKLRQLGVTVRSTIECIIATRCIESGHQLLHSDRDFDPFAQHLGLRVV